MFNFNRTVLPIISNNIRSHSDGHRGRKRRSFSRSVWRYGTRQATSRLTVPVMSGCNDADVSGHFCDHVSFANFDKPDTNVSVNVANFDKFNVSAGLRVASFDNSDWSDICSPLESGAAAPLAPGSTPNFLSFNSRFFTRR